MGREVPVVIVQGAQGLSEGGAPVGVHRRNANDPKSIIGILTDLLAHQDLLLVGEADTMMRIDVSENADQAGVGHRSDTVITRTAHAPLDQGPQLHPNAQLRLYLHNRMLSKSQMAWLFASHQSLRSRSQIMHPQAC